MLMAGEVVVAGVAGVPGVAGAVAVGCSSARFRPVFLRFCFDFIMANERLSTKSSTPK